MNCYSLFSKRAKQTSLYVTNFLQAFLDFEADESMHVAVLYGLGGNFCAGFDLDELAQLDEAENLANVIAARMIDRGPMGPTRY